MPPLPLPGLDPTLLGKAITLVAAFIEQVRRSADHSTLLQYDPSLGSWQPTRGDELDREAAPWQGVLLAEGIERGAKVTVLLGNRKEWALLGLTVQGLGLVTVPLLSHAHPVSIPYLLERFTVRRLLLGNDTQWLSLLPITPTLQRLQRVRILEPPGGDGDREFPLPVAIWLPPTAPPSEAEPLDREAP